MFLLKLGGSAIAPKDKYKIINHEYLERFSNFFSSRLNWSCALVHWAGSYGHGFVNKFGLNKENNHLLRAQMDEYFEKIDVYFPWFKRFSAEMLLHKDAVWDYEGNIITSGDCDSQANVISWDNLFSYLLSKYKPKTSFMLTDVDGVRDEDDNIITEIKRENMSDIKFWKNPGDVTGSMWQKIKKLFDYNKNSLGSEVWIVNAHDFDNRERILETGDGVGTKVVL